METLKAISVMVIAAIMVLVPMFLIPVLVQVRRTAKEAEKLIESVRAQVAPISHDISLISRDVQSIAQFIHRQADRVETGIEAVHDMAVRVKEFRSRIMKPLIILASILGGLKQEIGTMARIVSHGTAGKTIAEHLKFNSLTQKVNPLCQGCAKETESVEIKSVSSF